MLPIIDPLAEIVVIPDIAPLIFPVPSVSVCPQIVLVVASLVALLAFPVILIPHVPLAPPPVKVGEKEL